MKKQLVLSTLFLLSFVLLSSNTFAQKAQRQANRAAAEQQSDAQMLEMLKTKSFAFSASSIVSTLNPNLMGVQLPALYGTWVTPSQFKAYMPIYGANSYTGQPSLVKRLDFYTPNYQYNVEQNNTGYVVTIVAMDEWTSNNYTFVYNISPGNNYNTLTISTPFSSPVTFQGTIQGY